MAGTTTYYGISYPTNTDYVKDGATAMQTIADGFDSAVAIPTYNNQTGTSYTFVLADAGKTVTSNNAAAVTFTIPPQSSVAWAANTTLTVRNLGAGVVTIAGGAGVTVTNTAQTVAQYGEVKLIRTASNAWTVVPASGSPSGLTLLNATTITATTGATINNVFSSTYDNYKIVVTGTAASGQIDLIYQNTLNGTPAAGAGDYQYAGFYAAMNNTSGMSFYSSGATQAIIGQMTASTGTNDLWSIDIANPATTKWTKGTGTGSYGANTATFCAFSHSVATAYDGCKIFSGSNWTGLIKIYGYQNS